MTTNLKPDRNSLYRESNIGILALIQNPYIRHKGDTILQQTLVSWVLSFLGSHTDSPLKRREILEIISILTLDNIFTATKAGRYISLTATDRYEELVALYHTGTIRIPQEEQKSPDRGEEGGEETEISVTIPHERHLYYEYLLQQINGYQGSYQDVVSYCPVLFALLSRIFRSQTTPFQMKVLASLAMSYLVLDEDNIPDWRECGYLDDIFVMLSVLQIMYSSGEEDLIRKNWLSDSDIIDLIGRLVPEVNRILEGRTDIIAAIAGLDQYQKSSRRKPENTIR
ncbi:MAG: hypothetical protein JXA44_00780 [Methanospirillaceae archaeon]|nr:hypothetical protein [Methanospirillaceae archaeon]